MAALPMKRGRPADRRRRPPADAADRQARLGRRAAPHLPGVPGLRHPVRHAAAALDPPMIQFAESFRLHAAMAEFLRREVYRHDGIAFHSRKTDVLPAMPCGRRSRRRRAAARVPAGGPRPRRGVQPGAQPVRAGADRADPRRAGGRRAGTAWMPRRGWASSCRTGRSGRRLQQAFPELCVLDPASGLPKRSAIDTVERFQGGERTVILVSATESDRGYLLASSEFLLDPRRLTVALSRAKRKMILVASRTIFELFSPDEEVFANSLLWKNLAPDLHDPALGGTVRRQVGGSLGRRSGRTPRSKCGPGRRVALELTAEKRELRLLCRSCCS